jgi:hypothetical protein
MVAFIKNRRMVITVKSRFRISELALAFKFLSNADLVLQLHFLEEKCSWLFGYHFLEHWPFIYSEKLRYHMIVHWHIFQ